MQLGLFVLTATMAFAGPEAGTSQPAPSQAKINRCLVSLMADRQVSAQEAGLLVDIPVKEGAHVEVDQVLAQINDSQAQMQKRVAEAELKVSDKKAKDDINTLYAEAARKVAESEYNLKKKANETVPGVTPLIELQKLALTHEQARLQIEKSKHEQTIAEFETEAYAAKVDVANDMIQRRRIKSPIAGEVVEIFVRTGEWVEPGNVVFRVVQMNRLRIEGFLNAANFSPSEVANHTVTIEVRLTRGRVEKFQGKVTFVNPLVRAGGDYLVWAEVDNRQDANGQWVLRPGMECDMTIDTSAAAAQAALNLAPAR